MIRTVILHGQEISIFHPTAQEFIERIYGMDKYMELCGFKAPTAHREGNPPPIRKEGPKRAITSLKANFYWR